jgi:hypothetical protein
MIGDVRRFSLRGLRGSCLQRVTLLAAMKPKQDLRTSVAVQKSASFLQRVRNADF